MSLKRPTSPSGNFLPSIAPCVPRSSPTQSIESEGISPSLVSSSTSGRLCLLMCVEPCRRMTSPPPNDQPPSCPPFTSSLTSSQNYRQEIESRIHACVCVRVRFVAKGCFAETASWTRRQEAHTQEAAKYSCPPPADVSF